MSNPDAESEKVNEPPIRLRRSYDPSFRKQLYVLIYDLLERYKRATGKERVATEFLYSEMLKTLAPKLKRFYDDTGSPLSTVLAKSGNPAESKAFRRYLLSHGVLAPVDIVQTVHAYLWLKVPDKIIKLDPSGSTDVLGQMLGAYFSDIAASDSAYQDESELQLVAFTYESRIFRGAAARDRYFVLLPGSSSSYLVCIDVHLYDDVGAIDYLDLHFGICLPGATMSPLLMRSHRHHKRLVGVAHTWEPVPDLRADVSGQLRVDMYSVDGWSFTPEPRLQALAALTSERPRSSMILNRVKDSNVLKRLEKKIAKFRKEYL